MKMFLLGMLAMYLVCGIMIVIADVNVFSKDIAMVIIAFPYFIFSQVLERIVEWFKYHNLKGIVYDFDKEKWYYCERKDFDKISNESMNSPNYTFDKYEKVKREFDTKYIDIWNKKYINNGWAYPNVNHRYAPRKVWKQFEKKI